jgi:predicted kinase
MPKIYVLIGPPNCGKTTWTRQFLSKEKESYDIISSDDIIEDLCKSEGINYSQGWAKYIGRATSMMKQNFADAVKNNRNIIYDQTNMGSKKRKSILQGLDNYEKIAVVFDCDTKTLFERNRKRAEQTGKFIPEDVIINMLKAYISPTKEEGFTKIIKV